MNDKHCKYFKAYPEVNDFWFSTDGIAFTKAVTAETHQATIRGGGKVLHVNRKDINKQVGADLKNQKSK